MSTNSALKARLERLGPVRVAAPPIFAIGEELPVLLRRTGPLDKPITVATRLRAVKLSLSAAHQVLNNLAARGWASCVISRNADIAALAHDLAAMNVQLHLRRAASEAKPDLAAFRAANGMSQREFADLMGIDMRTLQNWEQGRNRPDPAVLSLMRIFAHAPEAFEEALFEPVLP